MSEENKAAAGPGRVEVKVRKRFSKRAVKKVEEDKLEAAARSAAVGRKMLDWYNTSVGESLLDYAQTGKGRRIHLLDATKIEVELEAGNHECSGVVRDIAFHNPFAFRLPSLCRTNPTLIFIRSNR